MTSLNSVTIGEFLRTLRAARRMTSSQAAEKAGLHRATLHRWEKGEAQPRLSELHALLAALEVSDAQKRSALRLMDAPRATRMVWQEVRQAAAQTGVSAMPHGGDLLRAMRLRRGLSLEEASRHVEVTAGTLRRWEKIEVWPTHEQLHRLCFALQAHEQEIIALTVGRFSQKPRLEKTGLDALRERFHNQSELQLSLLGHDPLYELTYLQIEADAWPLALKSAAGKQMLIEVYASHAQQLSIQDRLREAGSMAERALELMTGSIKPQRFWLYPVIIAARASTYRGERPAPERGVEKLRPWLEEKQWPDMRAWMLAETAQYLGMMGSGEVSLLLAEQACQVADTSGVYAEWCQRKWDKAMLLLKTGNPDAALILLAEREPQEAMGRDRVNLALLRAEVHLATGDRDGARNWLQSALEDIDTHHIEYRRSYAEKLTARL